MTTTTSSGQARRRLRRTSAPTGSSVRFCVRRCTVGPGAPDPEALRKVAREVVMVRISLVGEAVKDAMS